MALDSFAAFNRALDAGQWHLQRFMKNAGSAHALQWADPTFASGQPPYDARVGVPLAFTPAVAARNDAIWFPAIGAGQHRHLIEAAIWSNQATFNGPGSVVIFDLVGFYPLIDGDSTDPQAMDNAATLPRYADGAGLCAVIVNHVAPAVQNGEAVIGYDDATGVSRTATVGTINNGINMVCSGMRSGTQTDLGGYAISLPRGVRKITSLTYLTPPGGLHCLYLIRPLATMVLGDNTVTAEKMFVQHAGLSAPRIHDGAWLSWFDRIGSGTQRAVNWFGHFTFVWG